MPERMISAMLPAPAFVTDGSKMKMNGNSRTPISAVKTNKTATSPCLKKRLTRYLSKWTEIAHRTGPENAKKTQDTQPSGSAGGSPQAPVRALRPRPEAAPGEAQFCLSGQ